MPYISRSPEVITEFERHELHRGDTKLSARRLAGEIMDTLQRLYPFSKTGALWEVRVDADNGVWTIRDRTSLSMHGYVGRILDFDTYDSVRRKAMLAGGEILERTLGRCDDEGVRMVTRYDGIPEKEQPVHRMISSRLITMGEGR